MKLTNLGGCASIHEYVTGKLRRLEKETPDFAVLFRFMFSEQTNVFYEKYENFRIVKTTYGEAAKEIEKRAKALRALLSDAEPQSVVGLAMENSLPWLLNYWAILAAGFRPLLMNLRLDNGTLSGALRTLGAAAVVSSGKEYEVRTVTEEALAAAVNDAKMSEPAETRPFGDTFFVMSSGTSEHVKLCAYTAKEIFSIIRASEPIVAESPSMQKHYEGELNQLTFLPFYHIFGFVAVYLWFGFFARTFVELKDYAPETILTTIRRHRVTHVFAVPLFWEKVYTAALSTIKGRGDATWNRFQKGIRIAGKLEKAPALFRVFTKNAFAEVRKKLFGESISFCISGGGPIRKDVLSFFNRIGYHMANGYGMSEIGISSVDLSEKAAVLETGSVGKPLASYEYRIREGELEVKSESAASYVITDEGRTDRPEWFRTRDLAEEKKGRYFVTGRSDDLIVDASGENLNPVLAEEKLRMPGIRNLAVVPVSGEQGILAALVAEISPYIEEERLAEIETALRKKLDKLKLSGAVRKIVFTAEPLIKDEEFKLNRKRIGADLSQGTLAERKRNVSRENGTSDPLGEKLLSLYAEALGREAETIGLETDFFTDEGGSSLDYLLLLSKIHETFGVSLSANEGEVCHTRKAMEAAIRKRMSDVDTVL